MGDFLTLDDGRTLVRASMGIAGTLHLTALQLSDNDARFKRWLADVADRPNGFASVDLRGLTAEQRLAFHSAARAAYRELSTREGIADASSHTYNVMSDLISMLDSISRGEPPETPPTDSVSDNTPIQEDLSQIWNNGAD